MSELGVESVVESGVLPSGWASSRMGDVAAVVGGGTPKASDESNFAEHGHAWITPADLSALAGIHISRGRRDLSDQGLGSSSAKLMPAGTVVLSSRAPIGYVAVAQNEISTNQGFRSFVCAEGLVPEYVCHWLRFMRPFIEGMGSGSTFSEISGSKCKEIPIRIAPTCEQRRIVAAVEGLLERVQAARGRLEKVPAILKRFRQSVLAAACSGRLTEDWREAHSPTLLTDDETGLPSTWNMESIGDHFRIDSGEAFKKKDYSPEGLRLLQIANVGFGHTLWEQRHFLPDSFSQTHARLLLSPGEIVIALNRPILRGQLKVAMVSEVDLPAILYQRVGRLRPKTSMNADYAFSFFLSREMLSEVESRLQGTDQPYLNTSLLNFPSFGGRGLRVSQVG